MLRRLASFVVLSAAVSLHAETLVVFLEGAPTAQAALSLRTELTRILQPAGIQLQLRDYRTRQGSESFERLMVARFRGQCSTESATAADAGPGSLASTQTEDGRVLPFTEIHCDRILQVLASSQAREPLANRPFVFGRALARVLAHEIFHFVAQQKGHSESGVAKACFRESDLLEPGFALDLTSAARLRESGPRAEESAGGER